MMKHAHGILSAVAVILLATTALAWQWLLPDALSSVAAAPPLNTPAPRIVGGEEAPVGAYPWMTAVFAGDSFCGGSLIHPEWVLTAAHCVTETESTTVIPANTVNTMTNFHQISLNNGIGRAVQQIIVHPGWNPTSNDNDIALLQLAQPINDVTPVVLAQQSDAAIFEPGDIARVMGWGAIWSSGPSSDVLLQVDLPIVAQETCNNVYGTITDRMICAGVPQGGIDSCQGDSGGPLVVDDDSIWKQVGIVSFGLGCAAPNTYGVYARVSELYAWIAQSVDLTQPATPTATPTATVDPASVPRAYLPQISGNQSAPPAGTLTPTATATANPTPSATPTATTAVQNPIANPGFEDGAGAGWNETSTGGFALVVDTSSLPAGIAPHAGQWLAWLGGETGEVGAIAQPVTVPASAPVLTFWAWITTDEVTCTGDNGKVIIDNQDTVADFFLCQATATTGWTQQTVDLSAYAGQQIDLQVRAENNGAAISNLYVDDFAFTSTRSAVRTPLVAVTAGNRPPLPSKHAVMAATNQR